MPHASEPKTSQLRFYCRCLVWTAWFLTLVVAASVYAGKAAEERSAFIRWRHQVREFWQGKNIWDVYMFPNPPILPLTLSPLMALPPVMGALAWYAIKAGLVTVSILLVLRLVRGQTGKLTPAWVEFVILALSLRPILSDLHHGNINLLILFLIVAMLTAWSQGYEVLAGLLLGLAITYKVTPALFIPYFAWKRSWRTVGATGLGIGLFLLIVPSAILGPGANGQYLASWWHRILSPYLVEDQMSEQEVNQSLIGVLSRLLTATNEGRYERVLDHLYLASLAPSQVASIAKGISVALVGLLLYLCRTKTDRRDDPRLLGEFALVVLTMLIVSERSWKHHFVTLVLPYTYLSYRAFVAPLPRRTHSILAAALALSALLILTTSTEVGGLFLHGQGHKFAQYYGLFFWGAVVLYVATAWRVRAEGFEPGEMAPEPPCPRRISRRRSSGRRRTIDPSVGWGQRRLRRADSTLTAREPIPILWPVDIPPPAGEIRFCPQPGDCSKDIGLITASLRKRSWVPRVPLGEPVSNGPGHGFPKRNPWHPIAPCRTTRYRCDSVTTGQPSVRCPGARSGRRSASHAFLREHQPWTSRSASSFP